MYIELLTNPTIIGSIIGAFVGAISSATFAIIISKYKFDKRKDGAKALIKSEINYIIDVLEIFKDNYLKDEIKEENKHYPEVSDFFNNLNTFPIITNQNWINLINFIPSIFEEDEINRINNFYIKCEEITDNVKTLKNKKYYNEIYFNGKPTRMHIFSNEENSDRNMFKNKLEYLINLGEEVLKIFK